MNINPSQQYSPGISKVEHWGIKTISYFDASRIFWQEIMLDGILPIPFRAPHPYP
jgi:hypothetical protein